MHEMREGEKMKKLFSKIKDILNDAFLIMLGFIFGKLIILALRGYRCPRCNYPVEENTFCENCKQKIGFAKPKKKQTKVGTTAAIIYPANPKRKEITHKNNTKKTQYFGKDFK